MQLQLKQARGPVASLTFERRTQMLGGTVLSRRKNPGRSMIQCLLHAVGLYLLALTPLFADNANPQAPSKGSSQALADAKTLVIKDEIPSLNLVPYAYYFQSEKDEGFSEIQRRSVESEFTQDTSNFRLYTPASNSFFWIAVPIFVDSTESKTFIIDHRYPSSFANLWIPDSKGSYVMIRNGITHLNKYTPYVYPFPYFKITLNPGKNVVYLRIETIQLQKQLYLMSEEAFLEHATAETITSYALVSVLLIIFFSNIAAYVISRKAESLIYSLYVASITMFLLWVRGIGGLIFESYTEAFVVKPGMFFGIASIAFMGLFVDKFLDAGKRQSEKYHKIYRFTNWATFATAASTLFHHNFPLVATQGFLQILVFSSLIVKEAIKGQRTARFYIVSSFPFCFSFLLLAYSYFFSDTNLYVISLKLISFATILEIMLLSLAINDKFSRKLIEQNVQIKIEQKISSHALSQLSKVVYPHQLAKIKNYQNLEETMPTSTAQACVMSFDVIGSSKIYHINAKEFFRNTFTRCNEVISEGYDGINLKANAFRIKEMGDGFLCSVGFPFAAMSRNPANDAVDLAKRFAAILAEEAAMLHAETPIACGIGIALDTITGFYPEAGTKEYDLYGQAIVLATRYEGMRKTLFEAEKGRSVIIIQEKVFQSLDPSHRFGFLAMDLKELGIVVRDDPAANKLYYQFLDKGPAKEDNQPNLLRAV